MPARWMHCFISFANISLYLPSQKITKYNGIGPQSIDRMGSSDVTVQMKGSEFTWWQHTSKVRIVSLQRNITFSTVVWIYCPELMLDGWHICVIFREEKVVMRCLYFNIISYCCSFTVDPAVMGLEVYTVRRWCQTTKLFPYICDLAWVRPVTYTHWSVAQLC